MKYHLISRYGFAPSGRSFTEPSQFVPDKSLSVQEILRRYATGAITDDIIVRDHQYGDDMSPDEDFDNMDPRYDPDYDLVDAFEDALKLQTARNSAKAEIASARSKRSRKRATASPQARPDDSRQNSEESDSNQVPTTKE